MKEKNKQLAVKFAILFFALTFGAFVYEILRYGFSLPESIVGRLASDAYTRLFTLVVVFWITREKKQK
ncbi:MAG: hypothetical protein ABID04_04210 [Patescibacteria group bacterium]